MNKRIAVFGLCLPFLLIGCKPKIEVKAMQSIPINLDSARASMRDVFENQLTYRMIKCPPEMSGTPVGNTEQYCFTSDREPEELLPDISTALAKYGTMGMQWRFDFGDWVTTYDFDGEKFGVLVSLTAPGNSPFLRDNPNYSNIRTFGSFIINDERTKKP